MAGADKIRHITHADLSLLGASRIASWLLRNFATDAISWPSRAISESQDARSFPRDVSRRAGPRFFFSSGKLEHTRRWWSRGQTKGFDEPFDQTSSRLPTRSTEQKDRARPETVERASRRLQSQIAREGPEWSVKSPSVDSVGNPSDRSQPTSDTRRHDASSACVSTVHRGRVIEKPERLWRLSLAQLSYSSTHPTPIHPSLSFSFYLSLSLSETAVAENTRSSD